MKKIFKMLVLLLIAGLLFAPSTYAKSDHAKQSLVALGDSIPYGFNLGENNNTPSKYAYPYLIGDEADLRVRNLGVPGWQTGDLLSALKTNQKYRQAVRHADYITLSIGSNDLLHALKAAQKKSGGDPALFMAFLQQQIQKSNMFDNIRQIITETRKLTDAPIAVYNIYNPFQVDDPLHGIGLSILPNINAGFTNLTAAHNNIFLADAYSAFGENQETYVIQGDIHPTIEGHAKLAEIGLDALNLN